MTIAELLSEAIENPFEEIFYEDTNDFDEIEILPEAKVVTPLDYKRHWYEFPKNEKHYSKRTGNRLYGCWIYNHREAAGAKYGDGKIVHHHDHNKHNNSKSNLTKMSQSEHCKIDPNSRKHFKCKICGAPHYSNGLCQKHYMRKFRAGKLGNYDKSKNYSKDER